MTEHTFSEQGNVWSVLDSHQKQIDAIKETVETARREIAVLASAVNEHTFAIGNLKSRTDHHRDRFGDTTNRFRKIEEDIILIMRRLYKLEHDRGPQGSAKRTIKGGWVNVYRHGGGMYHPTREDADSSGINNRIACIQIPDFQEGEGL